ncbi:MAG: transcriptional repressor [Bradyrhizobium sp.]|nr:MAG: transcriptional repressor [Bradyrhizobium sp.]
MSATAAKRGQKNWPKQVEAVCVRQGLQLTPLRRRVLSILGESAAPLGAYAIIDRLSKIEGKQIAPPTVYRTLEFFAENGFLHKIESRNVFARCEHVGHAHYGALLLCETCGRSEEIEDEALDEFLKRTAARAGFALQPQMLELQGLCKSCAAAARGA